MKGAELALSHLQITSTSFEQNPNKHPPSTATQSKATKPGRWQRQTETSVTHLFTTECRLSLPSRPHLPSPSPIHLPSQEESVQARERLTNPFKHLGHFQAIHATTSQRPRRPSFLYKERKYSTRTPRKAAKPMSNHTNLYP